MENKISEEKIKKYFRLTETALEIVKQNINKKKKKEAEEIINMASNYLSDASHFYKKGDVVNSFAALNYSHGWIDCGARLRIFIVSDNNLFTVP